MLDFQRWARGAGAGLSGMGMGMGVGGGGAEGGRARRGPREAAPREPLGKLFDREPPAALEAEMSLLGSMILDPRVIGDVLQVIRSGDAFYDPRHGLIYQGLVEVFDKHHTGDLVQIRQWLADKQALDQCGGEEYLVQLASAVPSAAHAPHFARLVAEKHKLRRLIEAAGEILFETYHAGALAGLDAGSVIDSAEQKIFQIAEEENAADPQALSQLLMLEYERLMAIEEGRAAPDGVRCGFYDLDEMLGGFQPGEMLILAARPSMGKTALALNIAEQIALGTSEPRSVRPDREPTAVGVFSLEMSKGSLVQRLLSGWSGLPSDRIRRGALSGADYDRLLKACNDLGRAPMHIDDTPGLTILQLRARARRMVHREGVRCLMIDYLQLLSAPAAARESRQVEVSSISRGLKALARELKVPIICLAQLNRGPETRDQNRPRLSDLRESGSLEQDADVVMLLHREEYYHIGDEEWLSDPLNEDKIGVAEVIIAKQRNGPTGTVRLTWDAATTRFKNHAGQRDGGYAPPPPPAPGHPPGHARPQASPASPAAAIAPVVMPARAPLTPLANAGPAPSRAFPARPPTGPVDNFRDGGGTERASAAPPPDDDDMPDPESEADSSAPF